MEAFTIFQATTYKTISIEKIKAALDRISKIRNQEWRFILKKEDEKYAIFQQKPQKNENETEDDDDDDNRPRSPREPREPRDFRNPREFRI